MKKQKHKKTKEKPKVQKRMVRLATVSLEEVLPFVVARGGVAKKEKHTINIKGYDVNIVSRRLATFAKKGTMCIACGIQGQFFAIEIQPSNPETKPHLNLYAIDWDFDEVLMTSDHVRPLSKGGADCMENRTTLCYPCNQIKSNKWEEKK